MRWYVSRNGQTVGPVDEHQVSEWIRAGMVDGMVRDEHGGPWMSLKESPFKGLLPRHLQGAGGRVVTGLGVGAAGFVAGAVWGGFGVGLAVGCAAGLLGLLVGNAKLF
jgi:hypothetical protein